ncbi:hypothetical protein JXO52_12530 [bacterium]|nr:hypothetical protein [bacterium]
MNEKQKSHASVTPALGTLLSRSLTVLLMSAVPVYGVLILGWDSVRLILLFLGEAAIILAADTLKILLRKDGKPGPDAFVIEVVFILFFGVFALLVYGPYDSLEQLILDRLGTVGGLVRGELARPLLIILVLRGVRLAADLWGRTHRRDAGRDVTALEGGPWAILLFLAVMAAPLVAADGPNPRAGLMVIVLLRTAGELIAVWSPLLAGDTRGKKR